MSKTPIPITYIVPAHNAADSLEPLIRVLAKRLIQDFPGSEIVIVENGSTDQTVAVATGLVDEYRGSPTAPQLTLRLLQSEPGLGNAMRAGVAASQGDIVTMTGGLAFGFTDLDATLGMDPRPAFAIGSKGHPDSTLSRPLVRRVTTAGFRVIRRVILNSHVSDSQGSFIMNGDLARKIFPLTVEPGFIAQTEAVTISELIGVIPVEVPVVLTESTTKSSVRPLATSWEMLLGLVRLWRRVPTLRAAIQSQSSNQS